MIAATETAAPPRLRIDDLAQRSGIASGTIRFYQREGLIPPPERQGRVAYYGDHHLRLLERVRALQEKGLPLAVIGGLLDREQRGEDVAGWLALDAAVFGRDGGGDALPADAFAILGMGEADVEALVAAGLVRRTRAGLKAAPGLHELTARLIEAGVEPRTIRAGAELIAARVRAVADAMAEMGWEVFAPERARIEADEPVAEEVLSKLETMRGLAERIVATLLPRELDEVTRRRVEAYAGELTGRREEAGP